MPWPLTRPSTVDADERRSRSVVKARGTKSAQKKKPADEQPKRAPKPRPAWDDTINDLSNMRLTPVEQAMRAKARISKHMPKPEGWFLDFDIENNASTAAQEGVNRSRDDNNSTNFAKLSSPGAGAARQSQEIRCNDFNRPEFIIRSLNSPHIRLPPPKRPAPKTAEEIEAEFKVQIPSAKTMTTAQLQQANKQNDPKVQRRKPTVREILHKETHPPPATHVDFDKELEDRKLFTKRREPRAHHASTAQDTAADSDRKVKSDLDLDAKPAGPMPRYGVDEADRESMRHHETPEERALRDQMDSLSRELAAARMEREELQRQFEKMSDHSTGMITALQTQVHSLITAHADQEAAIAAVKQTVQDPLSIVRPWAQIRPDLRSDQTQNLIGSSSAAYGRSDLEPVEHRPIIGPRDKAAPGTYTEWADEARLPSYAANRHSLFQKLSAASLTLQAPNATLMEPPVPVSTATNPTTRFTQQEDGRTQAYSVPTSSGRNVFDLAAESRYGQAMAAAHGLPKPASGYHQETFLHGGSGAGPRDALNLGLGPAPRPIAAVTFANVARNAAPQDSLALSVHIASSMQAREKKRSAYGA